MSRPSVQYSDARNSVFSGNVQSKTNGPLTHQYPSVIPYHSYGSLTGVHPNPPQFYPSDGASTNAMGRHQYLHTTSPLNTPFFTSKNKYNAPMSSSMRTAQNKVNAIGKSGYKVGLPNSAPLSYKGYSRSDEMVHTRFVRSGGCVAPKKCGSIYNKSNRNGSVGSWGEIPRQNY